MERVVSIPKPCGEDWNAMPQEAGGRFCAACTTVVTDFTTWEPEAIAAYLQENIGKKVCGRFRNEVVRESADKGWLNHVFAASIPVIRKIAAAVLFFFGTGLASGCMGASRPVDEAYSGDTTVQAATKAPVTPPMPMGEAAIDTTPVHDTGKVYQTLGIVAPPPPKDTAQIMGRPCRTGKTVQKAGKTDPKKAAPDPARVTMGAPVYVPAKGKDGDAPQ